MKFMKPNIQTAQLLLNNTNITFIFFINSLRGDNVSMLTHIYAHKPLRKIEVTICNHQADIPLNV